MKEVILSRNPDQSGALNGLENCFIPIGLGLEVALPKTYNDGDTWFYSIQPLRVSNRVSFTTVDSTHYIVSESEPLSQISGNLCYNVNESSPYRIDPISKKVQVKPALLTEHIEEFFNHLFVAIGKTLYWSNLNDLWTWTPDPKNESDFRIFEWESHNISSIIRSGDKLYVHFPTSIYEVSYVGKPTIVSIESRVHGVGCIHSRAVITNNNIQYFLGSDNFYIWSYQTGLQKIGQDIWKDFVKSAPILADIWIYIDHKNNEIGWVTNTFVWVLNYLENSWTKYSLNDLQSQASVPWFDNQPKNDDYIPESELIINIDKYKNVENLYLTSDTICREQRYDDHFAECQVLDSPYLETDDLFYDDLHLTKVVDLLVFDANYELPWDGVKVSVSGRDFISEPICWKEVGVWKKDLPLSQLDFLGISGKVLRFKFELVETTNQGVALNGGLQLDGNPLDVANGQIMFDGKRPFIGRQFLRLKGTLNFDGQQFNPKMSYFELNAWGERVDVPKAINGPDK